MMRDFANLRVNFSLPREQIADAHLGLGWSEPEPYGCWAIGEQSTMILPPARARRTHRMGIDMRPFIAEGHIERQRLECHMNGNLFGRAAVSAREGCRLTFELRENVLNFDGPNFLSFHHPDFGRASTYFDSIDNRDISIMFNELNVNADGADMPASNQDIRTLFIVTGACAPGEPLNIELVRFLYSESCDILLWVDFAEPDDFVSVKAFTEKFFPSVRVFPAPKAIWGGSSIVLSMLRALRCGLLQFPEWTQVIFTSIRDFPLMPRTDLLGELSSLCFYDFCASKWNDDKSQVISDDQYIVRDYEMEGKFIIYPYRPDVNIRVHSSLADIATKEIIYSGRITKTLRDRYSICVHENFCSSTLSLLPMTAHRARERADFFSKFELIAGRMWVFCSRRFAKILISDDSIDKFQHGFSDILIPDECFFQSMAEFFAKRGEMRVLWRNLLYKNGDPCLINENSYKSVLSAARQGEIFARKCANLKEYADLLKGIPP